MVKVTVLYGHPADAAAFEEYYAGTHSPLVAKTQGIAKAEYTKFFPDPDGSSPVYYRMAELYFESPEVLQATMGKAEGQAIAADLANFATGGVKILVGALG